jgi:hypothetical protein
MTASRTILIFKLWAAVVMAVIGLQAMVPVQAPLQRETGSAFSASTSDVALATARRVDIAKVQAIPSPPLLGTQGRIRLLRATASLTVVDHLRPDVRGPPPRDRAERLPDLRGPPLA